MFVCVFVLFFVEVSTPPSLLSTSREYCEPILASVHRGVKNQIGKLKTKNAKHDDHYYRVFNRHCQCHQRFKFLVIFFASDTSDHLVSSFILYSMVLFIDLLVLAGVRANTNWSNICSERGLNSQPTRPLCSSLILCFLCLNLDSALFTSQYIFYSYTTYL